MLAVFQSESAPSTSGSSVAATLSAFAAEIWRIAFPRSLETISAVAHPQRAQPITATNRVVDGGRAAWNKYINPNLIAVATVRSLPQYSATQTGECRSVFVEVASLRSP